MIFRADRIGPPRRSTLYRQRQRIENMFGRLKDWRRIHTPYDRCAHSFISAVALALINEC
jgi:transposase